LSDIVEVIVTGPPEFMPGLVETLVNERLIACGQLTPINAIYRWQGQIEHAPEVRAVMHTTSERADSVMQRVRQAHPYKVPCILVFPVKSGEDDYIAWVKGETIAD